VRVLLLENERLRGGFGGEKNSKIRPRVDVGGGRVDAGGEGINSDRRQWRLSVYMTSQIQQYGYA